MKSSFILYVEDQDKSTRFYEFVLNHPPLLNVPGMTEFKLNEGSLLGLMPLTGIRKLLGEKLPDPRGAAKIPRAELYLIVDGPQEYYNRALQAGAVELSKLQRRDWGDRAAYCMDLDGHVIAFAEKC